MKNDETNMSGAVGGVVRNTCGPDSKTLPEVLPENWIVAIRASEPNLSNFAPQTLTEMKITGLDLAARKRLANGLYEGHFEVNDHDSGLPHFLKNSEPFSL